MGMLPKCDTCISEFFGITECQACGCNSFGSSSLQCDGGGICNCKPNFMLPKCDTCKSEFFGITECQACGCNATGSVNTDCNKENGICDCKANFMGEKCETCKPGFFGPTCEDCNCYPDGSVNNIVIWKLEC